MARNTRLMVGVILLAIVGIAATFYLVPEVTIEVTSQDVLINEVCMYFQKGTIYSPISTQRVTWAVYEAENCTGTVIVSGDTGYGGTSEQTEEGSTLVKIYEDPILIECRTTFDCGWPEAMTEPYCEGDTVFQMMTIYSCEDNICDSLESKTTIENCDYGCLNGVCLPSATVLCGDGICQETCETCQIDCGTCLVPLGEPLGIQILQGTPIEMPAETQTTIIIAGIFVAILFAVLLGLRKK